eukprot:3641958-Pleurochrysis_carterae.AAC.1
MREAEVHRRRRGEHLRRRRQLGERRTILIGWRRGRVGECDTAGYGLRDSHIQLCRVGGVRCRVPSALSMGATNERGVRT